MDDLLPIATLVLGVALGFFSDLFKSRLGAAADRRKSILERSDRAAEELVLILDEIRALYFVRPWSDEEPDWRVVKPLLTKIRQRALFLADEQVGEQISLVADILGNIVPLHYMKGETAFQTVRQTCNAAHWILGRLLHDLPAQDSEVLDSYRESLNEYFEIEREEHESEGQSD